MELGEFAKLSVLEDWDGWQTEELGGQGKRLT